MKPTNDICRFAMVTEIPFAAGRRSAGAVVDVECNI
jgi:hypothetical protein